MEPGYHHHNAYKAKQLAARKGDLQRIMRFYHEVKDMVFVKTYITPGTSEEDAARLHLRYDIVQKDALYRPAAVYCYEDPAVAAFFGRNKEANIAPLRTSNILPIVTYLFLWWANLIRFSE